MKKDKNGNFILVNRSILEWGWADDLYVFKFFICCIMFASFKPQIYRGIKLKRGQFITSLADLSERTGLSINCVKSCIKKLKSTGEISEKIHPNKYRIITVNNYNNYQSPDESVCPPVTNSRTNSRTNNETNNRTTYNKENKEKKIKNSPSDLPPPEGGANTAADKTVPKNYNPYVIVRDYAREHKDELGILSPDDAATMFSRGFKVSGQLMPDNWTEVFRRFCSIDEGEQYKFYKHLAAGGSYKWS